VEVKQGLGMGLFHCLFKVTESRSRIEPQQGFRADELQTQHQSKEERSPSCSISRSSVLCHFEGEEVFSLADSDILAPVCASPASDGHRKNGVQTKHLRRTSLQSLERPPVCMDLIQIFVKSLLLVRVLMRTFPAEECAGRN
jgi:hypothetical protein